MTSGKEPSGVVVPGFVVTVPVSEEARVTEQVEEWAGNEGYKFRSNRDGTFSYVDPMRGWRLQLRTRGSDNQLRIELAFFHQIFGTVRGMDGNWFWLARAAVPKGWDSLMARLQSLPDAHMEVARIRVPGRPWWLLAIVLLAVFVVGWVVILTL